MIQERNINTGEMVEFEVTGDKIEAIHISRKNGLKRRTRQNKEQIHITVGVEKANSGEKRKCQNIQEC